MAARQKGESSVIGWRGLRPSPRFAVTVLAAVVLFSALLWAVNRVRSRTSNENSIAVLPFINKTGHSEDEYFSDGMTEQIITVLGRVDGLRVLARDSSFMLKDRPASIGEAGRALGARFVLTGSVFKADQRLRVNAQLTSVSDGMILWKENYDRRFEEVFAIQDDIASAIVSELSRQLKLGAPEPSPARPFEAYDWYLKGLFSYNKGTKEDLENALASYQKALEIDPKYALAWVGRAEAYRLLADAYLPPHEAYPKAKHAVMQALRLDDSLPEAHIALGGIKLQYEWDPVGAREEFSRVERQSENNPLFHENVAWLRVSFASPMEGVREMQKALKLDPLSERVSDLLTWFYYLARDDDAAIAQDRRTLELGGSFSYQGSAVAGAYRAKGMLDEALKAIRRVSPDKADVASWDLAVTYAKMGEVPKARDMLRQLEEEWRRTHLGEEKIAAVHVALGDNDRALEWLEKAYQARCSNMLSLGLWREWDPLRGDPRFKQLLERVGVGGEGMRGIRRAHAPADERPRNGTDFALLVATDHYVDKGWPKLMGVKNDVEVLKRRLTSDFNFQVDVLRNPDTKGFLQALIDVNERMKSDDDQLLVFVAGHGGFDRTFHQGFLALRDTPVANSPTERFVSYPDLAARLDNMKFQHILFVLDVCYGGQFAKVPRSNPLAMRERTRGASDTAAFVRSVMAARTRRFLAAGMLEVADADREAPDHSPFVNRFLRALDQQGEDGVLSLNEVYAQLESSSRTATPLNRRPLLEGFGSDEPNSNFLFIRRMP